MEYSPSAGTDSCSTGQGISPFLWNPKVCYSFHKNTILDPILSQMNLVQIIILHLCSTMFNAVLPSAARSPKWSLSDYQPNISHVIFEVFTAVRMVMISSGFCRRVDSSVDAKFSHKHTLFIFWV
jgi:hypothetical protein